MGGQPLGTEITVAYAQPVPPLDSLYVRAVGIRGMRPPADVVTEIEASYPDVRWVTPDQTLEQALAIRAMGRHREEPARRPHPPLRRCAAVGHASRRRVVARPAPPQTRPTAHRVARHPPAPGHRRRGLRRAPPAIAAPATPGHRPRECDHRRGASHSTPAPKELRHRRDRRTRHRPRRRPHRGRRDRDRPPPHPHPTPAPPTDREAEGRAAAIAATRAATRRRRTRERHKEEGSPHPRLARAALLLGPIRC